MKIQLPQCLPFAFVLKEGLSIPCRYLMMRYWKTLRTPGMSLLLDLAEVFHFYNSEKQEKLAAFVFSVFDFVAIAEERDIALNSKLSGEAHCLTGESKEEVFWRGIERKEEEVAIAIL
ncbi:hypothetical protein ACFX1W_036305 [Malus domestica]